MITKCPHCSTPLEFDADGLGREVECPGCKLLAPLPGMVCKCRNCSANLEFEIEALGRQVECPGCKLPTVLQGPPPAQPKTEVKATRNKIVLGPGGWPLEEKFDSAWMLLVILGFACLFSGIVFGRTMASAIEGALVGLACWCCALQAAFCSEMIKIGKKVAGISYSGTISGANPGGNERLICSACSASVGPDDRVCGKCSAEFE